MAGKKPVSDSVFVMSIQRLAFAIIFILACSAILLAQSDTQPPRLNGLGMNVSAVDVTSSSQVVTFALAIQDDLSGIDSTSPNGVAITLSSPSNNQVAFGLAAAQSGVILNGVFQVPVTLPRYGQAGNWRITSLRLRDNAGNAITLDNANLISAGFPTIVPVSDANPDMSPPQLLGVAFSLASIDVGASSQSMTVDLVLSDDLSGVGQGFTGVDDFVMTSPSGKQSRRLSINQFQLISGSNTLGTYRATLTMPQYSEPGVWKVSAVRLRDNAGSQRLYDGTALASFGSTIHIVSSNPPDTTPPQLTGLTFTPAAINTSSSSQDVQVDFTITDNSSGVSFAPDNPFASVTFGATFVSPSGAQSVSTNSTFSSATPLSGVPTNGTWRFTATFPRFSEEGTWKASVSLKDAVRNLVNYSPTDLASLALSRELIVNRPTQQQQVDGTISDPAAGGSVSDNAFGDRARVIVPGNVLSQPTAITIDVLQSPPQVQLPAGFSGSESYFVNIEFVPVPSFPLPAPGLTLVLPLRTFLTAGTAINLFRINTATGFLVAALNSSGNPIVGHVDSGGLSATFPGVIQLSTIVGLLPTTPVNGTANGTVEVTIESNHPINIRSHAKIPVIILSSAILDATKIDPSTLRFAGASVDTDGRGRYQISISDENGDGLPDMIANFRANELHLDHDSTAAVLEGRTFDLRAIHGVVRLRVLKKGSGREDDEDENDD